MEHTTTATNGTTATPLTNLPALFQEPEYGGLVNLPDVLSQNQSLQQRAVAKVDQVISALPSDLAAIPDEQLDTIDAQLNNLAVKLDDSVKICNDRRSPYTRFLDRITKACTAIENTLTSKKADVKWHRDSIAKEKVRRMAAEQERQAAVLAKKHEAIELAAKMTSAMNAAFATAVGEVLNRMVNKYYGSTIEELDDYLLKLAKYTPVFDQATYDKLKPAMVTAAHHSQEECIAIASQVAAEKFGSYQAEWVSKLTAERDRLIELIPSRKDELVRMVNDAKIAQEAKERQETEQRERDERLAAEARDKEQATAVNADAEKLNAQFDVAASATPVRSLAKGTQVKRKYNPTTHAAFVALIQSWVKNDMPGMSLDELAKKLSFTLTAANKRLNDGEVLEAKGLEVEEDFSTRASRSKTA